MTGVIRKVGWLHIADRRLLCVRTAGRGLCYIPGGKPEPGEDNVAALVREIAEELAVALVPETIAHAGRFSAPADGSPDKIVEVDAYHAEFTGTLAPGSEIAEHCFLSSAESGAASAAVREVLQHLKASNVID